ncbi:kinase-like domain-containing protein [Ochromonadaceae sp. CCMP2298]|nr:kinase-like domain-containing protein [Ochromonadaceae sp. CCMP2298]|mmetsp:Transcript_22102/g.49141  ORF Transcript_22102/g.49141 Transcript_22102/m.49141 type:complete len:729 (+) Transcript_22102:150-2336(+)
MEAADPNTQVMEEEVCFGANETSEPLSEAPLDVIANEQGTDEAGESDAAAAIDPLDAIDAAFDEKLVLKNLDTGESYIIGENDPDFDFDTFELRTGVEATPIVPADALPEAATPEEQQVNATRRSWWAHFLDAVYGVGSSKSKEEQLRRGSDYSATPKPRTPFTKLSNFKFRKELGRGAFGRVLLAESKADGKLFALKIIPKKNMRSSDKRQAKAERDILHSMAQKAPHPFTSGLKFAFQSENNLYLGMDFIPGGNLRELIKRFKFLPEDWVRFYAAELVLAISHLHSLNVLYRDIKPHNVMIDARGHMILIDFGLSKQEIVHHRGALSLVGTPDYSAPEVLKTGVQQIEAHNRERANAGGKRGAAKDKAPPKTMGYGKAADWWSLGIMIYEMLSGTPTFRGSDLRQTYQKILYADLEFVPEERFSVAARMLLSGMIRRDPSARLGAWENPPRDIMSSPFFAGVQWDAIYERRTDGPFIPELVSFNSARKASSAQKSAKEGGEGAAGAAESGELGAAGTCESPSPAAAGGGGGEEEEDEDGDDLQEDELEGMRDSVFIRPRDAAGQNLLGWSFIDESVLAGTMNNNNSQADKDKASSITSKEKKDKKDKRKKKDAMLAGMAKKGDPDGEKISDKVENKIAFRVKGASHVKAEPSVATVLESEAEEQQEGDEVGETEGQKAEAEAEAEAPAEAPVEEPAAQSEPVRQIEEQPSAEVSAAAVEDPTAPVV